MKLETYHYGSIEVEDTQLLTFEGGIPGFEQLRSFILLPIEGAGAFRYFQSCEDSDIVFLVANPFAVYPDYEFDIPVDVLEQLVIENAEDVDVWSIVTVAGEWKDATLNLLAPIIVNRKRNHGKQSVLHQSPYSTKHRLFQPKGSPSERSEQDAGAL